MKRTYIKVLRWVLLAICVDGSRAALEYILAKPGLCPPYSFICYGSINILCKGDQDCIGDEKCCNFRCNIKCTKPVPVTLGKCSPDTLTCTRTEGDQCSHDTDCMGSTKCCMHNCTMKCRFPVRAKLGTCPEHTSLCPPTEEIPPPKCTADSDCPGKMKCCVVRCSQECVGPKTPDKEGLCPPEDSKIKCTYPLEPDQCLSDGNCPDDEKCCGACAKKCTKPQREYDPDLDGVVKLLGREAEDEAFFAQMYDS
ncbi:whey acidic protein-like isoform X2 [Pleurodeles waltl]|uniref:whey acidic protein-like isoform X2 n=1 Tax=Pleurodeles waltl TaxID=8319 RepID=UPI003709870F